MWSMKITKFLAFIFVIGVGLVLLRASGCPSTSLLNQTFELVKASYMNQFGSLPSAISLISAKCSVEPEKNIRRQSLEICIRSGLDFYGAKITASQANLAKDWELPGIAIRKVPICQGFLG